MLANDLRASMLFQQKQRNAIRTVTSAHATDEPTMWPLSLVGSASLGVAETIVTVVDVSGDSLVFELLVVPLGMGALLVVSLG